jgi:hypothetical protein
VALMRISILWGNDTMWIGIWVVCQRSLLTQSSWSSRTWVLYRGRIVGGDASREVVEEGLLCCAMG